MSDLSKHHQPEQQDLIFNDIPDEVLASQLRKPHDALGLEVAVLMNKGNSAMNRHAIAVLHAQAGEHILEIGMGNGAFVSRITNVAPGIRYIGCDYSDEMVESATSLNAELVEKGLVRFVKGALTELPFEDNSFDKALTVNTLYFWDDYSKCLAQLKRVLKPDGLLILSIRPKVNMLQHSFIEHGFRLFDADEVIKMLDDAGFKDIERTSVQEPPQQRGDSPFERSSLIFRARNHKTLLGE